MSRRTLAIALPVATLLLVASAGSVSAECFPLQDDFPPPRYAFTATVADLSREPTQNLPGMAEFDWHLELDVDHTYRGEVPSRLGASGWDAGCDFTGIRVREGERLFIAARQVDPGDPRLVSGTILLWRDIGGGHWEFYADALHDGALGYPPAAIRADTIERILAVIRELRPPDTSTAPKDPDRPGDLSLPLVLGGLFVVAFVVLVRPGSRIGTSRPGRH